MGYLSDPGSGFFFLDGKGGRNATCHLLKKAKKVREEYTVKRAQGEQNRKEAESQRNLL